jgi:hypothetical protein
LAAREKTRDVGCLAACVAEIKRLSTIALP